MKAAVVALLGAALVFSAVLAGVGGRQQRPGNIPPSEVQVTGKVPPVDLPAVESEPTKRKRRRDVDERRVREIRRRVEQVAVGQLEQVGVRVALGLPDRGAPGPAPGPRPGPGPGPRPGPGDDRPPEDPDPRPRRPREGEVRVPDLLGLDEEQAENRLERRALELGEDRERDSCKPQDTVLRQSIDPGTFVDEGTVVNITVASGHEPRTDNSGPGSDSSGSGSDGSDGSGSGSDDPCDN